MKQPGIWILVTLLAVPAVSVVTWWIEAAHADYIKLVRTEIDDVKGLYQQIAQMPASDWSRVRSQDRLKMAMAGAFEVAEAAKTIITEIERLRAAGRRVLGDIDRAMADPANRQRTLHMVISRVVKDHEAELLKLFTE